MTGSGSSAVAGGPARHVPVLVHRAIEWLNVRDGGLYSLHMTDPFGYDVQISGLANNALTDG